MAWPRSSGERARKALSGGHVELELDQVDAGRHLGHGVLDLEAGVDLQEGEGPLVGLVEELDGAGVPVPGGQHQVERRPAQLPVLVGVEDRRGGLLDQLLAAPLDGAVAHAERPGAAVVVGDDLHLDVARAGHEPLHQHARVAEGAQALLPRPLERGQQLLLGGDDPDAAPPATGSGLDHQRVADLARVPEGVAGRVDRAPAPGGHRDPDLLGEELGGDLVAEAPHHVRRRPDEGHAEALAELGERRVLGDEAPPDPGGGRLRRAERPLELGVVDVGVAAARGSDEDGLVGLADERRPPLGLGVEGDRAEGPAALVVQLACRVDQAPGGLASVDDRDAAVHCSGQANATSFGAATGRRAPRGCSTLPVTDGGSVA